VSRREAARAPRPPRCRVRGSPGLRLPRSGLPSRDGDSRRDASRSERSELWMPLVRVPAGECSFPVFARDRVSVTARPSGIPKQSDYFSLNVLVFFNVSLGLRAALVTPSRVQRFTLVRCTSSRHDASKCLMAQRPWDGPRGMDPARQARRWFRRLKRTLGRVRRAPTCLRGSRRRGRAPRLRAAPASGGEPPGPGRLAPPARPAGAVSPTRGARQLGQLLRTSKELEARGRAHRAARRAPRAARRL
jgi:hypothetical protein